MRGALQSRVTLNDVAKAAGVSVMTVSNVINGKHGTVGGETRRRVEREVKRLGYRPHEVARSLRLSRSFSVGMIIVTSNPLMMAIQFISTLVTGATSALRERGYSLVTEAVHPDQFDRSTLLRRAGLDGIIAHLAGNDRERVRYQKLLKSNGSPLVFIQDRPLIQLKDHCCINQDDFHGGRILTHLALDLNAERILFLKPALEWPAVAERERGIRSVLADRGAAFAFGVLSVVDEGLDAVQSDLASYVKQSGAMPDFILCSNDQLAVAAVKFVQSTGLKVPDDVNVTGFNNFEFRRYTDPTLTTIQSEIYEMGYRAGTAMVHRLEEGAFTDATTTLPVSLVLGGSTARLSSANSSPARQQTSPFKSAVGEQAKKRHSRKDPSGTSSADGQA
jgi:LacI family transcriptional regulator